MKLAPLYALETRGTHAVLYLRSPLSAEQAREAMRACHALPPGVRWLRIDMRALSFYEALAMEEIARQLRPWRESREGGTRVDLPGVPMSFEVLAAC